MDPGRDFKSGLLDSNPKSQPHSSCTLCVDLSLLKLSRSVAIFEFSSLSPSASFNMKFECRGLKFLRKGYFRLIPMKSFICFWHFQFGSSKCKAIIYNNKQ